MLKNYWFELLTALTVAFMVYYPPQVGVYLFALTLAFVVGLGVLEHFKAKELPELTKLKAEIKDMKSKVEQLILGRNR